MIDPTNTQELDWAVERWVDVYGFEDCYQVSSLGRIRSKDRMVNHYRPCLHKGRLLKQHLNNNGYCVVRLYRCDGFKPTRSVHRVVLDSFIGVKPEGMGCNHIDGLKTNNSITNLEWVTSSENNLHKCRVLEKGIGEGNPRSKLTETQIIEMRRKYKSGCFSRSELAKNYSVTQGHVWRIVNRKQWNHIAAEVERISDDSS